MCRFFKKRDYFFWNCQICASKTAHCGDHFLPPLQRWLCVGDTCRFICQSCPSRRHSFASLSSSTEELLLCLRVDKAFIPQVTHPLGCCCDNVGHVHLLGVRHHRRVDGSRRGVCSHEGTRNLQRPSISHVAVVKLKLKHNCPIFDCSQCGESHPQDSTHTLHHG